MNEDVTLIDDVIEENMRKLYFSCEPQKITDSIIESEAYVNHSKFGKHYTTILLCTEEFLQSVDVIRDEHPDKERSLDDFFVSDENNEKNNAPITSIVLHPYTFHPELSEKTGRDYVKEMDECMEYIKYYL